MSTPHTWWSPTRDGLGNFLSLTYAVQTLVIVNPLDWIIAEVRRDIA
jgi:hypothetical protein